jgi:hypothetical protein
VALLANDLCVRWIATVLGWHDRIGLDLLAFVGQILHSQGCNIESLVSVENVPTFQLIRSEELIQVCRH